MSSLLFGVYVLFSFLCYFQIRHFSIFMSAVPLNPVSAGIATDDKRGSLLRTFHCESRRQRMLEKGIGRHLNLLAFDNTQRVMERRVCISTNWWDSNCIVTQIEKN